MLKVGILGAGFMGGTHAAAFAGLPDVQIVGISSLAAKAATLAAKYGAEPYAMRWLWPPIRASTSSATRCPRSSTRNT